MSKVLHTQAIRQIFGAAVDGDSASIAYQAEQLAQKLDRAKEDLLGAADRAKGHAGDLGRSACARHFSLESQSPTARAALLAQTATECGQLAARIEGLEVGLFALVQAAGKGKEYVEAKRAK